MKGYLYLLLVVRVLMHVRKSEGEREGKSQMGDLEEVTEVLLGFYKERERESPPTWTGLQFFF